MDLGLNSLWLCAKCFSSLRLKFILFKRGETYCLLHRTYENNAYKALSRVAYDKALRERQLKVGTKGNVRDEPSVKPPVQWFGADRDKE